MHLSALRILVSFIINNLLKKQAEIMMGKKCIIVGGGLGGLSTAIYLANKGFKVQIFERQEKLGGKMNEFVSDGYRFDTGPSLLTMPFVVDDLFQSAGAKRSEYLEFVSTEPVCRYFWNDCTILDASTDRVKMLMALAELSATDAQNYEAFLRYSKRIYDLTADIFLFRAIHEFKNITSFRNLTRLFRINQIDPFHTVHQGVTRFFKNPKIVQLFDRYATYNGSDPYQAPATLNIIPYVEYSLGSYYIKGGMYRLIEAAQQLAEQSGVEIYNNSPVEKIIHRYRRIAGIQVSGDFIPADYVICNADVVSTYNELIDGMSISRKKLNKLEPSLSGMVFLWGIKERHQALAHHNIIFSANYKLEFQQLVEKRMVPDDPTIYIAISSKSDSSHAPRNGENWFVLINTPYSDGSHDWKLEISRARNIIYKKLIGLGVNLSDKIITEKTITPDDFYNNYRSNCGSIYGISSNNRMTAFRRPANRNRDIRGLYFVGGSSHPGGGVPLVILSGRICAELIA
jgi:phytoene desaturase